MSNFLWHNIYSRSQASDSTGLSTSFWLNWDHDWTRKNIRWCWLDSDLRSFRFDSTRESQNESRLHHSSKRWHFCNSLFFQRDLFCTISHFIKSEMRFFNERKCHFWKRPFRSHRTSFIFQCQVQAERPHVCS